MQGEQNCRADQPGGQDAAGSQSSVPKGGRRVRRRGPFPAAGSRGRWRGVKSYSATPRSASLVC
eukprot:760146-Hanusia_phi.AAC.2